MVKKIQNPYEYLDYRLLLNDDFLARTSVNHSYSLRAYARDLELSPSFVSDVLHGKRELSAQTSRDAFSRLVFELEELEFLSSLVEFKQAKDPIAKQNAQRAINRKYQHPTRLEDASKDLIMKSADHFFIHGLVGGESDRERVVELAAKVSIAVARAVEVIEEFVHAGYFRAEGNLIFIEHLNLTIPDHSQIFEIQRQFVNRLIDVTIANGGNQMPEQMGHYLCMGFDRTTFPVAVEAYKHLINTLNRLSNQTPTAERYAFFSSSFYSFEAHDSP